MLLLLLLKLSLWLSLLLLLLLHLLGHDHAWICEGHCRELGHSLHAGRQPVRLPLLLHGQGGGRVPPRRLAPHALLLCNELLLLLLLLVLLVLQGRQLLWLLWLLSRSGRRCAVLAMLLRLLCLLCLLGHHPSLEQLYLGNHHRLLLSLLLLLRCLPLLLLLLSWHLLHGQLLLCCQPGLELLYGGDWRGRLLTWRGACVQQPPLQPEGMLRLPCCRRCCWGRESVGCSRRGDKRAPCHVTRPGEGSFQCLPAGGHAAETHCSAWRPGRQS
jgi:hypothetical protein